MASSSNCQHQGEKKKKERISNVQYNKGIQGRESKKISKLSLSYQSSRKGSFKYINRVFPLRKCISTR